MTTLIPSLPQDDSEEAYVHITMFGLPVYAEKTIHIRANDVGDAMDQGSAVASGILFAITGVTPAHPSYPALADFGIGAEIVIDTIRSVH